MLLTYILAYGYYAISLIPVISSGILFFRTKTKATAMFFFGLLFSLGLAYLSTAIWLPESWSGIIMALVGLASFVSSIGFLLYALSLPKLLKT